MSAQLEINTFRNVSENNEVNGEVGTCRNCLFHRVQPYKKKVKNIKKGRTK